MFLPNALQQTAAITPRSVLSILFLTHGSDSADNTD